MNYILNYESFSNGIEPSLSNAPRFYTSAKSVNVSPSGSDSNDGLAVGSPVATIAHAVSLLPSGGKVFLQPGNYQLTAPITLTGTTDLTIEGCAPNATSLIVNGNFDHFDVTGITARLRLANMWLGSFAVRSAGYGVKITGTSGTHSNNIQLENLVIQNTAQGLYAQYSDSMIIDRVRYVQSLAGAASVGSIFTIVSSATAWVDRSDATSTNGQIAADGFTLDSDTDTMIIGDLLISNCAQGVVLKNTLGGSSTGPRLVRLRDAYVESCSSSGYFIADGRDVRLRGCHSAVNSADGFTLVGGNSIKFDDCIALQNAKHGYNISGVSLTDTRLIACDASNNSTASVGSYSGAIIGSGVSTSHVRIIGGRFGDFIFPASPSQQYGISITTTTDYVIASMNDCEGNMTGGVNNLSTGTHNSIGPNI